jgi:ribosomal 50S subunit-associated protein YjgA (DUF615 family)
MNMHSLSGLKQYVEEETTISPHRFSRLTLAEARNLTEAFYNTQKLKTTENRKRQIFEQILRNKARKLLVI